MPRPTIKSLQDQMAMMEDRLNKALEHEAWQTREINDLRKQVGAKQAEVDAIVKDKQWLRQLCQEQSSSIAGYMRSR